ncbi:hypothetical protein SO802_017669 [Lithocarpus litseifolius]|uniref:Uncharacterized protein n=1 Tax=Lithocarpus litseifolius TaxID=425828 RepID=A0AAW2CKB7_9ROSI
MVVSLSIHIISSSPTSSLEVTASTPSITRLKGKRKVGKSVWDDPTTTLGRAHNVITDDKLKGLTSIPSQELVSRHIHKLVQVLVESLCLTTDYLSSEEKVMVANSKLESVEAESSKLRKDPIEAMDGTNKVKEKIKELNEALRVEKMLVI